MAFCNSQVCLTSREEIIKYCIKFLLEISDTALQASRQLHYSHIARPIDVRRVLCIALVVQSSLICCL